MKPLAGIVVLDLTRVLAGPYATMILGQLGARIIKIERPEGGDDARGFGPFHDGESAYFASVNAGKESLTLDLRNPRGKQLFERLVGQADVLVENFVPGVMDRLGLGCERLRQLNPRLIYAAASGFGQTGPLSRRPAYDLIVQAAGGLMSITGSGEEGSPPLRVGTSIGDIAAALYTAIGIMTALYHRERTGLGQQVDVAMLDCQVAILENAIARYETTGKPPRPLGNAHPSITPFQAFPTADSHIIVAAGNDKLWQALCRAIGRPELLEREEFRNNHLRTAHRGLLEQELGRSFRQRATADWHRLLEDAQVPSSPIHTVDQVLVHPQVQARQMIVETSFADGTPLRIAGNPIKMDCVGDEPELPPAPALGAQSAAVLGSLLGLGEAEIEGLRREKVI